VGLSRGASSRKDNGGRCWSKFSGDEVVAERGRSVVVPPPGGCHTWRPLPKSDGERDATGLQKGRGKGGREQVEEPA